MPRKKNAEEIKETEKIEKENKKESKPEENKPSYYKSIGSFSALIENEFAYNNLSPLEEEERTFKFLRKCKNNGEVLVGSVFGIVDDPKHMLVGVAVSFEPVSTKNHYGMVEVVIPDFEFFESNTKYPKDYAIRSPKDQYNIRKSLLMQYMGAKIHFCVTGVERKKGLDRNNPDVDVTTVHGNRNEAMRILRDKYFFHSNRKITDKAPIVVKPGDIVEAFVVSVSDQSVNVTALGVETRIYLHDLTKENITSCIQYTFAGDILPECRIVGIKAKDGNVELRLSNIKQEAPKMILSMKRGNYYKGRVTWYNPEGETYTVYLDNGVKAFIKKENVQSFAELSINDTVWVFVTAVFEETVIGNAIKR